VAPHSEGCEFPQQIEKYRGIVEEASFDRLSRPSFFDAAVGMVIGRIAAKIEERLRGNGGGKTLMRICATVEKRARQRQEHVL